MTAAVTGSSQASLAIYPTAGIYSLEELLKETPTVNKKQLLERREAAIKGLQNMSVAERAAWLGKTSKIFDIIDAGWSALAIWIFAKERDFDFRWRTMLRKDGFETDHILRAFRVQSMGGVTSSLTDLQNTALKNWGRTSDDTKRTRFYQHLLQELSFWQTLNQRIIRMNLAVIQLPSVLETPVMQYVGIDPKAQHNSDVEEDQDGLDRVDRALLLRSFADNAEEQLWNQDISPATMVHKISYLQRLGVKFTGEGAKDSLDAIKKAFEVAIACCAVMQKETDEKERGKQASSLIDRDYHNEVSHFKRYAPLLKRIFSDPELLGVAQRIVQNEMLREYQNYCLDIFTCFPALKLNALRPHQPIEDTVNKYHGTI